MLRGLIFTGLALIVSVGCATPVLAKTFQSDPASAQVLASEVVAKVSVSALAPSENRSAHKLLARGL